ncbi:hypothetical protein BGX26_006910 [Mortierella sp. AD094]|nr:hypothetical protein BGX26_006910 [Mortierella sp. AD094]
MAPSTRSNTKRTLDLDPSKPWPFDAGYRNCPEVLEPTPLKVSGTIPPCLEGSLYRSGPGYEIQKGGRATYRSRNTCNDVHERFKKAEEVYGVTFSQRDPCKTIFKKFFSAFKTAAFGTAAVTGTNINVPVIPIPNFPVPKKRKIKEKKKSDANINPNMHNLVITNDVGILQEVDPQTMEPLDLFTYGEFSEKLMKNSLATAHPCTDPETGDHYTILLTFGSVATYKIVHIKQSADGTAHEPEILAEIKSPRPTYLHSFLMTKRYVVMAHWNCDFAASGLSVLWYDNAYDCFKTTDPNAKAAFYVIDRQKGGHDHTVIADFLLESLRDEENGRPTQQAAFRRYRLKNVTEEIEAFKASGQDQPTPSPATIDFELDRSACNFELPSINPSNYIVKYRYAYGINRSGMTKSLIYDRIIKVDLEKVEKGDQENCASFWMENQCTPSEPVFVARPGATEEEDGVLLSIVLDGGRHTGFLLVLDARTLEELARAEMPEGRVAPHNFHGVYIPDLAV